MDEWDVHGWKKVGGKKREICPLSLTGAKGLAGAR